MKAIIKKTGEAILVTRAGVTVNDAGERMVKWYCADNDTLYDTEELMLCNIIDWEQRRYEIAKACVAELVHRHKDMTCEDAVKISVEQADALIKELKK